MVSTTDDVYRSAFMRGMRPEPMITVSEWSDQHRVLSPVASGEPGPWRTARTPYLKEIMDCLSPASAVERVVLMKGSQLGGTEAGLNFIGYVIHHAPGPMMMVQPTVEMAKSYSKQRITPLIEDSPVLSEMIKPNRSRDSGNTIFTKEFVGGILRMVGANSAVGLRSMPVRYLFMDEVDAYPGDVDGEGDPVALAIQRTVTFANRKILMVSTPTLKGFSRIETAYQESDQRRYWVPCPACHGEQILEWQQLRWPEGQRDKAVYVCRHCGVEIQDHQKGWMLTHGRWQAQVTHPTTAGFHLSSLYSPLGWVSWSDIAEEHGQVYRDPSRLKVWVNTKLAETWEEEAEQVNGTGLMERRESFGLWLPSGVVIITAGIDVQDDRLEVEFVGWGRDEESWSVDYRIIHGDPSTPVLWHDLDTLLRRSFAHARQCSDLSVRAAAVDTGGHHTLRSYDFCRLRQDRRIWAIKGRGGAGVPIWPRRPSRSNKGRVPLFMVGVDSAKDAIYARLRIKAAGPGYCHFPLERDEEWFKQLTAERVTTRYHKGRPMREWIKRDSDRNEALDCRVYAMAALHGLVSMGLNLNREADRLAEVPLKEVGKEPSVQRVVDRPQRRVIRSPWM
ncbi:MAG: phage terminase large subunit family protein [Magnetococcales bacterium]|nr:phage terminase large subunit family protein [Magnetococcales bacterium]